MVKCCTHSLTHARKHTITHTQTHQFPFFFAVDSVKELCLDNLFDVLARNTKDFSKPARFNAHTWNIHFYRLPFSLDA